MIDHLVLRLTITWTIQKKSIFQSLRSTAELEVEPTEHMHWGYKRSHLEAFSRLQVFESARGFKKLHLRLVGILDGTPSSSVCDRGPEARSKVLTCWGVPEFSGLS